MRALRKPQHDATSSFGLPARAFRELADALGQAKRLLVYSGSGLSADSGLPTYRGEGKRLWTPELLVKVATFEGFRANSEFARAWYEEQGARLSAARPHEGHRALRTIENWGQVTHVTQNVDRVLEQALAARVLHIHGSFDSASCLACTHLWPAQRPPLTQPCPKCGQTALRPGIVMQGEVPPADVMDASFKAARAADLVLVVGTPAEMYPGAAIVEAAHDAGVPVCVINPEWCDNLYYARWQLYGGAQEALPALVAQAQSSRAQTDRPLPWFWRWVLQL